MGSLYGFKDSYKEPADFELKPARSGPIWIISILAAVAVTAALLLGYLIWRKRHAEQQQQVITHHAPKADGTRPQLPVKVRVLLDEPIRKGPEVIIGGTVQNRSGENLSEVAVEFELTHKRDDSTETRVLGVEPKALGPGQEGKYSLTLAGDYSRMKLLRVVTGAEPREVGFSTAPGAKRPFESPRQTTKTIVVNPPGKSTKEGEEFINTPDNPSRIP
jgi:hypothetical protein